MSGLPTDIEDAGVVARRTMNARQRHDVDREEERIALMQGPALEDEEEDPNTISEKVYNHLENSVAEEEGWQGERFGEELNLRGDDMEQKERDAAVRYLQDCGLDPTPDAVEQLTQVFLRCLTIMCHRGWDPEGGTWRQAGALGALADVRKKFMRLWERAWMNGARHDDSAIDMINYLGFYLRSDPESERRWGEWGEPGEPQ